MTSSMLAGERRWASARRGGMTVLGKVAVPKPINLPSQKLENHGLDPNVEIVPKGSLSWGSRPSSSTSNPWGSPSVSPNTDGSTVSPHHPSGRPSSGGGLSRPSTAGSDKHEPSSTTRGLNSRPSSASGVLTSNQSSLTSSRPLSAETRPGSSHLSRFAEPAYDNSAWGPNVNADKLTIPSKANDFSLSSGDFPTLGSEKDNTGTGSEPHDHGSHVRPGSGSGRTAPVKDRNVMAQDHKSGTVDTWTRDGSPHFEDVGRPSDKWQQGDPQQYVNPNIPPSHFDAWRGPPMNAPPGGVWYRGPPAAGPPYPPVPHDGYPMQPYPYYHPQIPPNLATPQPGPLPGPGPRGYHPRNGDFYRPQMPPEAFMRPNMPIRPGYYPGPVAYDGYYGPPMGYNPSDRDIQFMGMPPGPHGPPVYNMGPHQNPSEFHDPHFRSGVRGPEIPANQKDPSLIQKIEDSNARASDVRGDAEQKNRLLVHSNDNPAIAFGTICDAGDINISKSTTANVSSFSRQSHTSESLNSMVDPEDGQAQRARMREMAKQRAIQLQKEEEERIKEQKAKARAKLEELNRRTLATSDGTTQTAEKNPTNVSEHENVDAFTKPTGPITDDSKPEPPSSGLDTKAQAVDQSSHSNQSVVNTDNTGNDGSRQKRASHRQKQNVQTVESAVDKSTIGGTGEAHKVPAGAFIKDSFNIVTVSVETVPRQEDNPNILSESTQQRKKNNKISKNKHKPDDVSASREGDIAKKTEFRTSEVTDSKTAARSSFEEAHDRVPNQYKPQHSRKMPRNPQVGDVAVWAPVRAPNKEEQGDEYCPKTMQDDVTLSAKSINSGPNNLKSKRAEMERYVPKPVAKELAQQEIVNPSSFEKTTLDDSTDICVSANVGPTVESKGDDNKQNKQMKPYGAWKQRTADLHRDHNFQQAPAHHVPTETKVVHEWDPSDGWCMPDDPPTGVKDDGGKGKRPAYKGQKSTIKSNVVDYKDVSGAEVEIEQMDRPTSSKENRWQPKPHGYRGGQNASSEVKRVQPEEPHEGHQAIRKERKPVSFRQQTHSSIDDEASFEQQHGSTGFRKFGGQNNRSVGQDDRRKHNQHNANINRERPRQNLHYEYQPVGSNNKPNTIVAPTDGFGNAGSRYKERGSGSGSGSGSGHPRRGGGTFNGRQ